MPLLRPRLPVPLPPAVESARPSWFMTAIASPVLSRPPRPVFPLSGHVHGPVGHRPPPAMCRVVAISSGRGARYRISNTTRPPTRRCRLHSSSTSSTATPRTQNRGDEVGDVLKPSSVSGYHDDDHAENHNGEEAPGQPWSKRWQELNECVQWVPNYRYERSPLDFRSSAFGGGPGCLHLQDFR
jgi:hypothetical protein